MKKGKHREDGEKNHKNDQSLRKLTTLALLLIAGIASAAIQSGYYRVKSYNDKYLTESTSSHGLVCSSFVASNYAQIWYLSVSGNEVSLKNALTERYIQSQTNASWQFSTGTSSFNFTVGESAGIYTFKNHNNGWWDGGLHCDASDVVVFWNISEAKSKWTVEAVDVDAEALAAQQAAMSEATAEQLTTFFTTTACTELKSPYNGYSDSELRSAMSALSTTVQNMAIKVKNNSWTTYSGWDKAEKTFRIADYKAYSSHSRWTSILGYGHLMGRLSNPTGIWVDKDQILQVYVGDIPDGESVALEVAGHGQASGTTYSLHEGMNCLLMATSGNCFVFYEVDNTTDGGTPYKLMSNYADVTVHIEGGTVQGYFDLTKGDDDDDWTQLNVHLLSKDNVCLKSEKHVMNLKKSWLLTALGESSVVDMMNVWKNLSEWEDELMGRSDSYGGQNRYGQYCNNITSVTSVGEDEEYGNPHASTYGTYYYNGSHDAIFNANALLTVADNMWCIAHEQGHNRQNPINMAGNTEISNNLFSNVAVYKQGRYTSRTASIQAVFEDYLAGVSWPERIARSCNGVDGYNQQMLRLNWSLYLYFHVNGNDPDFFPRLFDALRTEPMTRHDVSGSEGNVTGGQFTAASDDYLKYYVKCCEVSGYDLTDFFASFGFFMIPCSESLTLDGITTTQYAFINDYDKTCLYVTQEMIDAAKATVAAENLPKCNITFIEDRVSAPLATYEGHAEGERRVINPDAPVASFGEVGEMGQYTDFDVTPSAYTYNISARGNVTVSGTGAVGIIVYDDSDNIVGFYNTNTFHLPASAFDESGMKSGYSIKAAAGNGTTAVVTYDSNVEVNEFPKTGVWYTFRTPQRGNRYMLSNGVGEGVVGATLTGPVPTDVMRWEFVLRDGETETFDIINKNDDSYLSPSVEYDSQISTSDSKPAVGWQLKPAATTGMYIVVAGNVQVNQTNNGGTNSYKIYNWGGGSNTTDDGCQFAIEEVKDLSSTVLAELDGKNISVSNTAADDLEIGQWYVMFDRGTSSGPHGYLYEKVASHTLYNTATAPFGTVAVNAKYLVRLIDAGDGKYYVQTGYGNYFWAFKNNAYVQVSAYRSEKVTVAKIAGTDGHFYLRASNNVILDANAISGGDATVVGYGTAVPTSTNGNNDWAFYPVTLSVPLKLNVVGDASYATFFYDEDVRTNENTKAYYITSASNTFATLTAVENEGRDIPAGTAVVLVNSAKDTNVSLTCINGLSSVVDMNDNLLKGTLVPMSLDLSDETPYYSLGKLDGEIGFYKFTDGTITLGANKAYLEVPAAGGVKGFALGFDETDGIGEIEREGVKEELDGTLYDLSGRRVVKPTHGIYILNGRKVVVK